MFTGFYNNKKQGTKADVESTPDPVVVSLYSVDGFTGPPEPDAGSNECHPARPNGAEKDGDPAARDAAIIRRMSNGLLRISEVGAIRCEHISTRENESGTLLIPRSKTDQEAEGREVYLQKRTMKAIEKYQKLSGVSEGPLFRRIYQNCKMGDTAIGVTAVRDMIKDVATKAQIDVTGISGHSFRVGTAQTLVEKKATMPQLQTAGRWKDTRMPARYTEKEELAHGVIATILGK